MLTRQIDFHPVLAEYVQLLEHNCSSIPASRKTMLTALENYLRLKKENKETAKLTFICTHNSRRSHLGQIWAITLAKYFGLDFIETYSGGTEATAFNPRAITAMIKAGFDIPEGFGSNPVYKVQYSSSSQSILCWSKKYDDPTNPQEKFAAIMTCDDADQNCPIVIGTDQRISLTYKDPKEADDTPFEQERYDERVEQIGLEMCWVMKRLSETSS